MSAQESRRCHHVITCHYLSLRTLENKRERGRSTRSHSMETGGDGGDGGDRALDECARTRHGPEDRRRGTIREHWFTSRHIRQSPTRRDPFRVCNRSRFVPSARDIRGNRGRHTTAQRFRQPLPERKNACVMRRETTARCPITCGSPSKQGVSCDVARAQASGSPMITVAPRVEAPRGQTVQAGRSRCRPIPQPLFQKGRRMW